MNTIRIRFRFFSVLDERLLRPFPGATARNIRIGLLRAMGASIGHRVYIGQGTRVINPKGLVVEDDVTVTRDCVLDARGGLLLKQFVLMGFETIVITHTHRADRFGIPIQNQGMFEKSIIIGERVWLGTRCIVLPGATISADCIIGSGSVVTKPLDDMAVYAGAPARRIGSRTGATTTP